LQDFDPAVVGSGSFATGSSQQQVRPYPQCPDSDQIPQRSEMTRCAISGSHSILVATGEHWLRWSFGQPSPPQSFFVLRDVFGKPIRAQHLCEIGNTQGRVQLSQSSHCVVRLL
jgi:hypothetical protein